ncbi:MAG: hypothetical protein KatS3mg007_0693 [Thermoanaerobaculum sp.]|nr:MAG: hypothetical protein KatS3mg007_0693 [Thermoanaerobaculum sp.]GBC80312.1 hypothetical protein HRbin09_01547 [bacterium HR09]
MGARVFRICALLLALLACGQPLVPRHLAGLSRSKLLTGRPAVELLRQLHQGRFQPPGAVVAEYGHGRLTLYLALFKSPAEAKAALEAMTEAMAHSRSFAPPRPQRDEPQRFLTVGPGGHHLFWRSENKVYWLAGDPERVFAAAGELPAPPPGVWL